MTENYVRGRLRRASALALLMLVSARPHGQQSGGVALDALDREFPALTGDVLSVRHSVGHLTIRGTDDSRVRTRISHDAPGSLSSLKDVVFVEKRLNTIHVE